MKILTKIRQELFRYYLPLELIKLSLLVIYRSLVAFEARGSRRYVEVSQGDFSIFGDDFFVWDSKGVGSLVRRG